MKVQELMKFLNNASQGVLIYKSGLLMLGCLEYKFWAVIEIQSAFNGTHYLNITAFKSLKSWLRDLENSSEVLVDTYGFKVGDESFVAGDDYDDFPRVVATLDEEQDKNLPFGVNEFKHCLDRDWNPVGLFSTKTVKKFNKFIPKSKYLGKNTLCWAWVDSYIMVTDAHVLVTKKMKGSITPFGFPKQIISKLSREVEVYFSGESLEDNQDIRKWAYEGAKFVKVVSDGITYLYRYKPRPNWEAVTPTKFFNTVEVDSESLSNRVNEGLRLCKEWGLKGWDKRIIITNGSCGFYNQDECEVVKRPLSMKAKGSVKTVFTLDYLKKLLTLSRSKTVEFKFSDKEDWTERAVIIDGQLIMPQRPKSEIKRHYD